MTIRGITYRTKRPYGIYLKDSLQIKRMPNIASTADTIFLGGEFGPSDLLGPFQFLVFKPINTNRKVPKETFFSEQGRDASGH